MGYTEDISFLQAEIEKMEQILIKKGEKTAWEMAGSFNYAVDEIKAEVSPQHELYKHLENIRCVAKCRFADDYLYFLPTCGHWAIVHLVFSGTQQTPPWPSYSIFQTVQEASGAMKKQVIEWGFLPEI